MKSKIMFFLCFFLLIFHCPFPVGAQNTAEASFNNSLSLNDTLRTLSTERQAEFRWDPFFGSGVISIEGHYASFFSARRGEVGPVLFDNLEFLDLPLPYSEEGELHFPEAFVAGLRNTFNDLIEGELLPYRIAAIVIDPGHGGRDSGAIGNHRLNGTPFRSVEKDIVLKVSLLLYEKLHTVFPDKKILLTRDSDVFITLDDRVELANGIPMEDNEAIIFVSVHANGSFNRSARGYEIWYLPPGFQRDLLDRTRFNGPEEIMHILNDMMVEVFTTESILLAQSILRQIDGYLGTSLPSRGLKENAWFVVRNARMPSVLVELGFVTNETDALLMNDDAYLNRFAEALYKGIAEFVDLFERSGGFTVLN